MRDALAESEAALKAHDSIGGERGQARFDDVMARLQATKFYRPTQTVIPVDRVGGSAGVDVEKRHDAEVARAQSQDEQVLLEIGKVGVAAGVALTTGNPAAILPVLALLGRHLLEALGELYTGESEQARLAHKLIRKGIISQVSMECDYAEGECSICAKRVKSKADYCVHLAKYKGGEFQGKPVFEILHGVTFTGLGLLDRKGADENARITQIASETAATSQGGSVMLSMMGFSVSSTTSRTAPSSSRVLIRSLRGSNFPRLEIDWRSRR